jgi:hypothetical protein
MATILNDWTKEEVRSVIRFSWLKGIQPVEIHRDPVTEYGPGVMAVQYVRKCCREFGNGQVTVADEQRSGRPSTSAEHVEDIDAVVRGDRCVSCATGAETESFETGTEIEHFTRHNVGYCSRASRLSKSLWQMGA